MPLRQHKFLESVTGRIHCVEIEYSDESDYTSKVQAIINENSNIVIDPNEEGRETEANEEYTPDFNPNQHYPLEDTGEYQEILIWI